MKRLFSYISIIISTIFLSNCGAGAAAGIVADELIPDPTPAPTPETERDRALHLRQIIPIPFQINVCWNGDCQDVLQVEGLKSDLGRWYCK